MRRLFTVFVAVALAVAALVAQTAAPAGAVTPNADVVAIEAGLTQFANFTHGLNETGKFGEIVPLLSVTPGEDGVLGFGDLLDKAIVNRFPANAVTLADLSGLSTAGADLEANGRHLVMTATPTAASGGSTTEQLKIDFTVTRTVDAGLQISSSSPAVQLSATQGVQTNVTATGSFTAAFDTATNFFYIVRTSATPSLKVDVSASIPDVSKVDVALGILAMQLTSSTFQVTAHFSTTWKDSNNDGKLAFSEPASGNSTTPGELAQAANTADIVSADYATSPNSTANGDLDLDTKSSSIPGLTLPSIPTSFSVASPDLSTGVPAVTTSTLDSRLVKFATLSSKDLATGLARLMLLVRAAQLSNITGTGHGNPQMPFINAQLADTIRPDELFATFLSNPNNIDQTTGLPQFASIQGFFDALSAAKVKVQGTDVVSAAISNASYDDSTSKLAFQIDVTRTGGTQEVTNPASNDPTFGTMDIGDGTRSVTGIRNATSPQGSNGATTTPSYTMHLPVVLDLRAPITGAACATANDPSNPTNANCPFQLQTKNGNQVISTQVVTSLPLTPERFLLHTGGTLLDADTTVAASIHNGSPVVGMAGFVQAGFDSGNVNITKGAAAHMVHIGLTSQGDVRFSAFLSQLQSTTPGTAISYDTSAQASASLHGFVPGSLNFFSGLTPTLSASSNDITQASNLQIVGPDFVTRLKPLDFGTDPDALRGATANALGALKDALNQLDSLSGGGATHERLAAKVQLLGRSLSSLVRANELDTFLQNISNNANGPNTGAPDSLQELITRANTALGANTIGFHMDGASPAQHLVLDVDYKRTIANDAANLGMRFQSGAKTLDLVGVDPDGALSPTGSTDTQLSLAVPLDGSAPSSPRDALVARTGSIAIAPDVSFDGTRTATIGALPVALGTSNNHAKITVQPRLTVNGPGGAGFVSLSNWLAGATSNAPGAGAATCPDNSTGKGVCANLPALADGFQVGLSGDDIFYGDGLAAITPDFTSTTPPSNLGAQQSAVTFDLHKITDGLDSGLGPFLDQLAAAIQTASGDGKLPFVGKDIAQGSDFIHKLKDDLLSKLDGLSANGPTINDVQNALTALNVNGLIGGVNVGLDCGGPCNPSHNANEIQGVTLAFKVGQGSTTPGQKCTGNNCPTLSPGPIDLGIPGVRLQSSASPEFALGWSLDFKVGFNKDQGFYVDASAPGNNALKLALAAFLPDFSGNVGFVTIDATDSNGSGGSTDTQHDHSEFQGLFDIHVNQLNGSSKLSLSDISSAPITQLLGISLTGGANVDYKLNAGVSSDLPGLSAEFLLNWHWNSDAPGAKSDLVLGFRDVALELKPLLTGLLSPVYSTFRKVVAPFKPIVDAVQAPLPGVSDVSRLVGGGDISILTLMKLYGTFSQDGGEQTQALERIIKILGPLVQFAGDGKVILGDFGIVPDKALAGVPTPDQIQSFITGNLLSGVNDVINKIHEKCAECADAINQLEQQIGLNELGDKSIGLHFPVLDNPGSLANLLLGADVPLVTYDTGPLHNHFDFAVTIGPLGLPIFIDIGVAATIDARFKAGFDTYGMRKALQGGGVASILDGLYLQDFDDQGHEKPEITIKDAMTYIDAKVSVVLAEAGVRGDIALNAFLDLRDTDSPDQPNVANTGTGDGKVRFSEIARDPQGNFNPFCLFDAKGDISARLVLFFRINFGLGSEEWDNVLAQSKILDIDYSCSKPHPDPVLAHENGTDLIIHVGKNGTDALRGDPYWGNEAGGDLTKPPLPTVPAGETQPTEITTVRALHDKDGNFLGFNVDLLGYHKEFLNPGLQRVVIDATDYDGEEVVNLMGDGSGTAKDATSRVDHFDKQAVFYGGKHDDQFKADSVAGQQIAADGGLGSDTIVTGYGNDLVAGGGGADNISTAGGNDKIEGDGKIFGGLAPTMDPTGLFANTPDSTDGKDNIDAGIGSDVVNGGGDDDFIAAGVDDGRAPTDPNNAALRDDNNVLIGGCGNDHINGGPHHDEIYGDAYSNALANGTATGDIVGCNAEADHIDTGAGNDLVFGGGGADIIRGHSTPDDNASNPKADVVYGNGGNDNIVTGSGDDTIRGGPDVDDVFGGTGNDLIHGDAGNDNLRGDNSSSGVKLLRSSVKIPSTSIDGNDEMYGDAGNDTMFGGGGDDLMFGDNGSSTCPAPTSTNPTVWPAPTEVAVATDGEDTIGGGAGNDIISGEGAKDTITGDTGNDRVCGHAGDDTISGNGGNDLLSGGSGGDTMYGDANDDHVEGNNGVDTISGGPGFDQLIGGTSVAASNDNGDTIYGDADADTIVGDNGTISDSTPPIVNVFDLTSGNAAYGGVDTIDGGYGNDLAFGGLDGDTVRGSNGDDHLEGNVGLDNIYGGPDQDDILGGTSPVALGGADPTSTPDVGDNIFGEGGSDVALGDNGVITRDTPPVLDGSDPSDVPMVHRAVTMLGVYTGGPIVGGNDNMNGGDNDDWMFGQAGNDTLNGDANSDHLEGNNATDTVNGGDGDDDIFGGTSPMALAAGKTTADVSDNGDTLNGDAGADYMLGDNGNLVHPLDGGKWARAQADNSFLRTPTMLDRLTIGGGDTMSGGADNDRMWGEVGNDTMSGNGGDDFMEGDIASDIMAGGGNDDDIIGGTSPVALPAGADAAVEDDGVVSAGKRTGNHICGFECGQTTPNGDNDVIAGNNARVDRCAPLAGAVPRGRDNCSWTQTSYGNAESGSPSLGTATTRFVTLLGESTAETNRNADDYIEGNSGNDDIYGLDGNDVEHGDTPAANSPRVVNAWASLPAASPDECLPVSDATAGQDRVWGGYGNDLGCGDGGNDALIGDRATVGLVPFGGALRTIDSAGPPNLTATFPNSGHTIYPVTLIDASVGGNDLLFGGPDNDSVHGGSGDDFLQGDDGIRIGGQVAATGNDILFGDNGNDSMEGGPGNDHSWGGAGNDDIDVWRDTSGNAPKVDENNKSLDYLFMNIPAYAARFPAAAGKSYDKDVGTTNDPTTPNGDIGYGGYNRDILQADTLNDRLVDSFGSYNLFFVCPAAYGGSQITRALSPGILTFFQNLGEADGATGAATPSSSGGGEVSIVYPATANPDNAGAAYKTTPGHFTCIP